MNFVEKVFGTHSDRELKYIYPIVDKIEKMRPTMQAMSDEGSDKKIQRAPRTGGDSG